MSVPSPATRRPLLVRVHRWLAALVFLLGILGAKALGDHFVAIEEERQGVEFEEVAQAVADDVQGHLDQTITALGGIADAAAVSGLENPTALRRLVALAQTRLPDLGAVGVARAVSDVAAHEARIGSGPLVKPTREGPAIYLDIVVPREGNEGAVGFDLLSERNRSAATLTARALAMPTASAPIQPVPIRVGSGLGAIVFVPIYEGGKPPITVASREARMIGGITSVFLPAKILPAVVPEGVRAEIWDVGSTDGTSGIPVHMASSDRRVVAGQEVTGPRRIDEQDVAGRRWQIVVDGLLLGQGAPTWLAVGVPFAGAFVAFLLAALVLLGGASLDRAHRDRELLALRDQEQRAVVQAFGDGYLRVDHDLVVRAASGGAWGGLEDRSLDHASGAAGEVLEQVARRALQTGEPEAVDVTLAAGTDDLLVTGTGADRIAAASLPSGLAMTIEVRATPVGGGVAISLRDVSARAAMEQELRTAHDGIKSLATALEQRVEDRTVELAELTKHLERTNDQLESFVYTAAHELRTPLTMMIGSLAWFDEYLELEGLEGDLLARSRKAAERMRFRIDQLVDEAHAVAIGERQAGPNGRELLVKGASVP